MKTTDIRDATWQSLQADMNDRLRAVYAAWAQFGPSTTRDLAQRCGIDILNVRPRTTDLAGLGLVKLVDKVRGEGVYRVATMAEWQQFADRLRPTIVSQPNLL